MLEAVEEIEPIEKALNGSAGLVERLEGLGVWKIAVRSDWWASSFLKNRE
jgi:hypothetical protein